jgi:NTE family protein
VSATGPGGTSEGVAGKPVVPRTTALVLSGGGARGAYEVGVLSYLFGDFVRYMGAVPRIDVICGTSVGGINGSYMAAHMADPVAGVRRLVDLWTALELQQVLRFSLAHAVRLPRMLLGGGEGIGIFDVRPMIDLVTREVSWRAVAKAVRKGHLRALSISTTEIATGRTTVFVDAHPDVQIPVHLGPRTNVVGGPIGPQHALASAAIPLIFPPVRVGSMLYCDGGLRQNTPMAPEIRMGAERVLVIAMSRDVRGSVASEAGGELRAPGATFLLGKVLNAFLLDHVQADLELLGRINEILTDGEAAYGTDFARTLSHAAQARGAESYRKVATLVVRPSKDMGRVAGDHVRKGRVAGPLLTRKLLNLLDAGGTEEADLASYLLFDGWFARKLIDMGRADAEAQRHQLAEFLAPG